METLKNAKSILAPSSIVVVGGGNERAKPGGRVVANLKEHGFRSLWVVNPKGGVVQDLPTFKSVDELPSAPELAILCVPAPHVLDSTRRLLARGTHAFIVLSAGFSEMGPDGRALEEELTATVRSSGGTMVGPNSLGIVTPSYFGVFGGPDFTPAPNTIDILTASGSVGVFMVEAGLARGLQFSSLFCVGNSAQLGVEDFLAIGDETFAESPAKVKMLYLEAVDEPARILRHARSLHAKGCRVTALKAGTTEVGARAAASHTGAMASKDVAVSALFDKAGIVRATSKTELIDVSGLLAWSRPPKNDDIVIVTHAGGPGIMLADELHDHGFRVPELPAKLQERILGKLLPGSSAKNPIDILAAGSADHLRHVFTSLAEEAGDTVGGVGVVFGSPGLFDVWPCFEGILEAARTMPFPVYPVLPSPRTAAREEEQFRKAGGFFFPDEVSLARALGRIRATPPPTPAPVPGADDELALDTKEISALLGAARAAGRTQLGSDEAAAVLAAAGFRIPASRLAANAAEAARAAAELGWPVVLKVLGPVHKSDVGGVAVGIRSEDELARASARLLGIKDATGLLVQQQASGLELILGATREGDFGHLLLFGLGGIFTETLRDVGFALAPLSLDEARRLIAGRKAAALLRGVRGQQGVDTELLAEALVRLSKLVERFPEIAELDVNPIMARGRDLVAVDVRIRIDGR